MKNLLQIAIALSLVTAIVTPLPARAQSSGGHGAGPLSLRFTLARSQVLKILETIKADLEKSGTSPSLRELNASELGVLRPNLVKWIEKLRAAKFYPVNRMLVEGDPRDLYLPLPPDAPKNTPREQKPWKAALAHPHACDDFRAGMLEEPPADPNAAENSAPTLKTLCEGPDSADLQVVELSLPYFDKTGVTSQEAFVYAFHEGGHLAEVPGHETIHTPVFDEIGAKLLEAFRTVFPDVQFASMDSPRVTPDLLYYLHDFHLTALNKTFASLLRVSDDVLDDYVGRWKCIARSSWDSDQDAHLSISDGSAHTPGEGENPMGAFLPDLLELKFEINKKGTQLTMETDGRAANCYFVNGKQTCQLDPNTPSLQKIGDKVPVENNYNTGGILAHLSATFMFAIETVSNRPYVPFSGGRSGWSLTDLHQPGITSALIKYPARAVCGKFDFQGSDFLLCRVSHRDREPTERELSITDPADGTSFEIGAPIEGAISDTGIFPWAYFLFSRGDKPGPKIRLPGPVLR